MDSRNVFRGFSQPVSRGCCSVLYEVLVTCLGSPREVLPEVPATCFWRSLRLIGGSWGIPERIFLETPEDHKERGRSTVRKSLE